MALRSYYIFIFPALSFQRPERTWWIDRDWDRPDHSTCFLYVKKMHSKEMHSKEMHSKEMHSKEMHSKEMHSRNALTIFQILPMHRGSHVVCLIKLLIQRSELRRKYPMGKWGSNLLASSPTKYADSMRPGGFRGIILMPQHDGYSDLC